MDILNLIIAIIALVIAALAFQRAGGIKDLRQSTAQMLAKIEERLREKEAAEVEKKETKK